MDQQEASPSQQKEIDAVLDAALDELDSDDENEDDSDAPANAATQQPEQHQQASPPCNESSTSPNPRPVAGPEKPPVDLESFDDMMKHLFQAGESGDTEAAMNAFMQQLQSQLASELQASETSRPNSSAKSEKSASAKETSAKESSENDVDRTITKLLDDMATASISDEAEAGDGTGEDQAMFKDMMKEFEKMGGAFDEDAVVDGMMQQLLSKSLMYEPMKQVTERFPSWLKEQEGVLSEEEHTQRSKQYVCFQKLIYVYETEPENVEKLMQLMQDVQEYGQPPAEIIKDIAPGLELDEEGVPKLDAMDGMPFGENEECSIM